jgi:hypothetical protein
MPMIITLKDIFRGNKNIIARIHNYIKRQLSPGLKDVPLEKLRIAATAIAGKDSVLAILQAIESGQYDCLVPIIVGTPAKFINSTDNQLKPIGLWDYKVRCDTVKRLKQIAENINKNTAVR